MYKDLTLVREHYSALRELIVHNGGGREDVPTRVKVQVLCEAAMAALDDPECRERLRVVDRHAEDLFSAQAHRQWDRSHMTGADYLRLQILIALEGLNTRLFFLGTLRDRAAAAAQPTLAQPAV